MKARPSAAARHPLVMALFIFALVFVGTAPAMAAPANDEIATAMVISNIPFTDTIDTTSATQSPDDPGCGSSASVWYTFTPTSDITLDANTIGSNYDTVLSVFSGTPGSLSFVDCSDDAVGSSSRVVFTASAGTTYYFIVGAYGGGTGGDLVFTLDVPPPPPPPMEVDVTIASSGSVVTKTGVATLSGTVSCNLDGFVELNASLTQTAGRLIITGGNSTYVNCSAAQPTQWTLTFSSGTAKFAGGKAKATLSAYGCSYDNFYGYNCDDDYVEGHLVTLRAKSK